tara:strand:- start:7396 stop:9453 length:2058 start_codon:yes stop_codon:yes gene_type:complete
MRLESIRNRSGLLFVVIGVAMFAFIMMDLMSSQRGGASVDLSVGEVYGEEIDVQEFEARVQRQFDVQKQNNPNIEVEQVRNSVWTLLTRELVFQKEYDASGISVCNEELFDMIQGPDPYPTIKESFTNPETGAFDRARLLQYLKEDMDNDPTGQARAQWVQFEEALYKERLNRKYSNAIAKGLHVSDYEAAQSYQAQSEVRNVSYVAVAYRSIADSLVPVTDNELYDYMNANSENYQQDASRTLEYVVFAVNPSKEDDAAALDWAKDIKEDFASAEDNEAFVRRYSDVTNTRMIYADKETLGVSTLPLFDAAVGTVVGPFQEGRNNYRLAKLVDVQNRPDSVQARHILLTDANAQTTADSLKNLIEQGASFSKLAESFSQDPGSASSGGDLGWFPEGRMVAEFNEACFSGKRGELQVVASQFGIHLIEVTKKSKSVKKVKIAFVDRNVVPSNETYQGIFTQAGKFAAENSNSEQFNQSAMDNNLSKRIADNLLESTQTISGLDNPRQMIRWAYEAQVGQVSDVMEFGNKFVVATLTQIKEEGMQELEEVRASVEAIVRNEKRAEMLINQLSGVTDLNTLSSDYSVEVKTVEGMTFNNNNVSGLGEDPAFVGAAFAVPESAVTAAFAGLNAVYVVRVDQVITAPAITDNSSFSQVSKINLQSRANNEAYQALEDLAEIQDYRAKFY